MDKYYFDDDIKNVNDYYLTKLHDNIQRKNIMTVQFDNEEIKNYKEDIFDRQKQELSTKLFNFSHFLEKK